MGHDYAKDLNEAREEFTTSKGAEAMLSSLRKAAKYCTGPKSSEQHGNRIDAVETVAQELKESGK